jgi:hypothetical protein
VEHSNVIKSHTPVSSNQCEFLALIYSLNIENNRIHILLNQSIRIQLISQS